MASDTLSGNRVVIIGGSSGIALATARAAEEHGAEVVIIGRSQERLDAAAGAPGCGQLSSRGDVSRLLLGQRRSAHQ